jgi:hypothetical protein
MKTTLHLDDQLLAEVKQLAAQTGQRLNFCRRQHYANAGIWQSLASEDQRSSLLPGTFWVNESPGGFLACGSK